VFTYSDLAELITGPAPYTRPNWIYEVKYDGFRMLASHQGKRAVIVSL
jgi:ATP-dependent DNA ligase